MSGDGAAVPVRRAAGVLVVALISALGLVVSGQELPAGAGRDDILKRCVSCHETDLMTQQRLTRAGWGRTLDKMVRWGAVVEPADRDAMLDYLAAHFAPTPAASHLVATAASEAVYKRACLMCHEADIIESQRLSRVGWVRSVDKMIRWGADVPAADKEALIDYLAARFRPR